MLSPKSAKHALRSSLTRIFACGQGLVNYMIIELKALYSFQVSVDDVAGMEVLKALCNFVELEYRLSSTTWLPRKKIDQFVNIRVTVISEIVQDVSMLHPGDNHTKRRKTPLVDAHEG